MGRDAAPPTSRQAALNPPETIALNMGPVHQRAQDPAHKRPVDQWTRHQPQALGLSLHPSVTHQFCNRQSSQRLQGAGSAYQKASIRPGTNFTYQWAGTSPRPPQPHSLPCRTHSTCQQAGKNPRTPKALILPTTRPTPALANLGSISQWPQPLVG